MDTKFAAVDTKLSALEEKVDIKFSSLDTTIKWVAGIICTILIAGFVAIARAVM